MYNFISLNRILISDQAQINTLSTCKKPEELQKPNPTIMTAFLVCHKEDLDDTKCGTINATILVVPW